VRSDRTPYESGPPHAGEQYAGERYAGRPYESRPEAGGEGSDRRDRAGRGRPWHPAVAPLAALAAGAAASAYLYRTDPHQSGHLLPRCPFNWLTGLLCPACGSTRLVYDLLHGDVARAFHDNGLVLLLSPVLALAAGRWLAEGLRGRRWRPVVPPVAGWTLLAVAVTWTVVRNVH
jgi:hypothetical protein